MFQEERAFEIMCKLTPYTIFYEDEVYLFSNTVLEASSAKVAKYL